MAKDRARDETRKLPDMGKALGWDRTSFQGVERAHRRSDKDKAATGNHAPGSFVPGKGHVDDEGAHSGSLGLGGNRKGGEQGLLPTKKFKKGKGRPDMTGIEDAEIK